MQKVQPSSQEDRLKPYTYLALGDSYTIGEGVERNDSFPFQLVAELNQHPLLFLPPTVIAQTGWTTRELMEGIDQAGVGGQTFDLITLLIGVNNQYRGLKLEEYEEEFIKLLELAIKFGGGYPERVIVLSIPDWGVTPFVRAQPISIEKIAKEIDQFNQICQIICKQYKVHFLDITQEYRRIGELPENQAQDQLHPNRNIYSKWAKSLRELIFSEMNFGISSIPNLLNQEKKEITDSIAPFSDLPEEVKKQVKIELRETFFKLPNKIYIHNYSQVDGLDIIIEGFYEVYFYDDEQRKKHPESLGSYQMYGGLSLLFNKGVSIQTVDVTKNTRIFRLPVQVFKSICDNYPKFKEYFVLDFGKRMSQGDFSIYYKKSTAFPLQSQISADIFYAQKVASLNPRSLITCPMSMPIYEVAERMAQEKSSCIFIADEEERIVGYVTDITLRDKVISQKISIEAHVFQVMEKNLVSIELESYIYEAILLMFQTQTRYLLLTQQGEYVGFISRNKLLSEQSQSPLVFIQSVKLATSLEELKNKWQQVPAIVHQLLERGVKSELVNQIITAVSDAITLRVIDKALHEAGPPPSKFVFITLGSEGRKEQTLNTDQDNAIIYEDKANEQREVVRDYFLGFAESVSNDLDFIGFSFCQGEYMAKNPKWTHSLSHWQGNFDHWMTASTQETVMKYSAFFDNRAIYGDFGILEELHRYMDHQLQAPLERFFFNMANNALLYEPPLTFFKGIRTYNVNEKKVFDIKKAMTPIVDLIRVFALKHRIFETNTGQRMKHLADLGQFSEKEFQELRHAYYYLMGMRLDSQATQIIIQKESPQNVIFLDKLTQIDRVALVEVFKVIKNFQLKIRIQFTNSLF